MTIDGRKVLKFERVQDSGPMRWRLYLEAHPTSLIPDLKPYFTIMDQTIIAVDRDDPQSFVVLDSLSTRHFLKVLS